MLRIILSIILGVLIPVVYALALSLGEGYISERWISAKFYGQSAPGVLLAPITLPVYFDIFTKENRILPFIFDTVWFRLSSFILFNWILYGLIAYVILGRFKRFRKQSATASPEPPSPPEFER